MKTAISALVAVALALASAGAGAQQKAPDQAQCQAMVGAMLESMRSTPLAKQKDRKASRELTERVERMVQENRARGVAECETWAAISKAVVNQ